MDKSQKCTIEQKSDTKENVLYDSIFISFKYSSHYSVMLEIRILGENGGFRGDWLCFVDLGAGYMGVCNA